MSNSKIPSPARSYGGITPRKYQPRSTRTRSVASPARSNSSTRLTALIQDAFHLSPIPRRRSVLNDDTDVHEPLRKSWWKNLDENSRDMVELFQNIDAPASDNVLADIDMEAISQEQNYSVDIPDSSDGESIRSIIVPQRKLFPRKENTKQKYFEDFNNIIQRKSSKSSKSIAESDKDITIAPRNLFNQGENRSIPIFPAGLLNKWGASTSVDTSIELQVETKKSRNLFGNQAGTKRKNTFIDFIVSDNEDEINDNQPIVFGFKRQSLLKPRGSSVIGSPTSSILDIEEEWQLLPSSTMIGHQSDGEITPKRRKPSISNNNKSDMSEIQKQKKISINKENNINNTLVASNINKDVDQQNNPTLQMDLEKTLLENKNKTKTANDIISESGTSHVNKTINKSLNVSKTKKMLTKKGKKETHQTSITFEKQAQEKDSSANNFNNSKVGFDNPNLSKQKSKQNVLREKVLNEMVQDLEVFTKVPNTNTDHMESDEDENIQLHYDENEGEMVSENLKETEKSEVTNVHEQDVIEKHVHRSDDQITHQSSEDELHTVVEQRQNASEEFVMEAVLDSVNESDDEQIEQEESEIERQKSDIEKSVREIEQEEFEHEQHESEVEPDASEEEQHESEIEKEQGEAEQDESKDVQQESDIGQEQDETEDEQQKNGIEEQQSEDEQEQEVDNEQIKQNAIRENDSHGNVHDNQDIENEIIDHKKDNPNSRDTKINETLKHPEAALNCKTNAIADSFLIDRRSLSIRKTKSVILHHELLQDRTRLSDGTIDSSANNSGWDSHRTTRKTLRQTFGKDFSPRKSLRTLVMEKSAKRQTYIADNIINGNKSKEIIEIRQSLRDNEENQTDSCENIFEQSSNDNQVTQAADSGNEKIAQMNNNDNIVNESYNNDEEKNQTNDCGHEETDESNNDVAVNQTDNHHEEIRQSDDSDHNEIESINDEEVNENNDDNDQGDMVQSNDDDEVNQSDDSDCNEVEESINDEVNETDDNDQGDMVQSNDDDEVNETDDNDQGDMVQSNDDEEINQSDDSDRNEIEESMNDEVNGTGNNDHEEIGHTTDDEEINHSNESDDVEMDQNHLNDNEEISKMPQANSTEYPVFESIAEPMEEEESIIESHHKKSQKKKKTMCEVLEQIRAENIERKRKIEEELDNWLKTCSKPSQSTNSYFKVPQQPAIRRPTKANKPKPKPKNLPFSLPEEFLEDLKYKPPKRYQPKNAAWATKRLYTFLETKLEPKYDYKARVRAEKLVQTIYDFTRDIRRAAVAPPPAVGALKQEMARLNVVNTHFDFYEFVKTYLPRDVRNKVVPSITNKIALPKPSVFADIIQ